MTDATPWSPAALFGLEAQVALVSASTRGLGWAMAQAIAGAGAHVVLNGRDETQLAERVAELKVRGASAEGLRFDATQGGEGAEAVPMLVVLMTSPNAAGIKSSTSSPNKRDGSKCSASG